MISSFYKEVMMFAIFSVIIFLGALAILCHNHRKLTEQSEAKINASYEEQKQVLKNQTLNHWLFKTEAEAKAHELYYLERAQSLFNASRQPCIACSVH